MRRPFDTSCFTNRVRGTDPFAGTPADSVESFLASAAILLRTELFQPLLSAYDAIRFDTINEIVITAHDAAAMEIGRHGLFEYSRRGLLDCDQCHADDALHYLSQTRAPVADRLSLIELMVRATPAVAGCNTSAVESRIESLLRARGVRLTFRNGRFEPSDGPVVEQEVHDPFWDLIADSRWDNVRVDMRTALSLRDSGGPNPALYAARALESTVKIVSAERGWLTGKERGAANVIDTLVSARNGRFIEPWEAEMLKRFFADVRNPDAHGAGSAPQPQLTSIQTGWAIEFCMISIKSLLKRF